MGLGKAIVCALIVAGIAWVATGQVKLPPPPPTLIAEEIAYKVYGGVCPRNVPRSERSDVCKMLFGQVEREYLASRRAGTQ
jgi:hypothetical protein